jgi:hypothetical protein
MAAIAEELSVSHDAQSMHDSDDQSNQEQNWEYDQDSTAKRAKQEVKEYREIIDNTGRAGERSEGKKDQTPAINLFA